MNRRVLSVTALVAALVSSFSFPISARAADGATPAAKSLYERLGVVATTRKDIVEYGASDKPVSY